MISIYLAITLYVSMAHYVEATGLHKVCSLLADETKIKLRARGVADYAVPVLARITATVLVVVMMGKLVKEG